MGQEQTRAVSVCAPGFFRHSRTEDARLHMTGKPVALMEDLLQVLAPNSHVFDPFAGSGSTLVAAMKLGHRFTGIELTKEYAAIAQQRLESQLGAGAEMLFARQSEIPGTEAVA
jgi:site-specific DNA-methyltransferase (adenine-specific)